jgi:hypothetical protein
MKKKTDLCVYCDLRDGVTSDHVFCRKFVGVIDRGNLPQVPACSICNNRKADLERYLTTVMPFGGMHRDAHRSLSEDVPRRLSGNLKLARELQNGMREETYVNECGEVDSRCVLPFDGEKLIALFGYITRGLIHWHWGHRLAPEYVTRAMVMREAGQPHWERMRSHRNATGLFGWSLAKDALRYEAFFDGTNPNVTAWQFRMYGGVMMAEDEESASMIIGQSVRESALAAAAR